MPGLWSYPSWSMVTSLVRGAPVVRGPEGKCVAYSVSHKVTQGHLSNQSQWDSIYTVGFDLGAKNRRQAHALAQAPWLQWSWILPTLGHGYQCVQRRQRQSDKAHAKTIGGPRVLRPSQLADDIFRRGVSERLNGRRACMYPIGLDLSSTEAATFQTQC